MKVESKNRRLFLNIYVLLMGETGWNPKIGFNLLFFHIYELWCQLIDSGPLTLFLFNWINLNWQVAKKEHVEMANWWWKSYCTRWNFVLFLEKNRKINDPVKISESTSHTWAIVIWLIQTSTCISLIRIYIWIVIVPNFKTLTFASISTEGILC